MMAGEVGVTVTLREIYDAAQEGAKQASGARDDVAALRGDLQALTRRVEAVERQVSGPSIDTLKKAAYIIGTVVSAVAGGWAAAKGCRVTDTGL